MKAGGAVYEVAIVMMFAGSAIWSLCDPKQFPYALCIQGVALWVRAIGRKLAEAEKDDDRLFGVLIAVVFLANMVLLWRLFTA